jgi:ectoine hydroxylase-related dioxygenase (phytanoyl-CoA dioxygenase family)
MNPKLEQIQGSREEFERLGYTIYRDVLDAELIEEARAHIDWIAKKHPDLRPEQYHANLAIDDPFWVRLVSDPRLLDVAEQFIGANIALYASHYISKPAGDGQAVLWHQDGAYWLLDPMEVVTLWLAVDDSTPENGCMRVIPESQNLDLKPLEEKKDGQNVLGSSTPDEFVDESKAVDLILKAGDVSVHHPNIIHGSNANTSDKRRCGLTIRYVPTTTRILDHRTPLPIFLLRGKAVPGINDYLPLPKYIEGEHLPFRGAEWWLWEVNSTP